MEPISALDNALLPRPHFPSLRHTVTGTESVKKETIAKVAGGTAGAGIGAYIGTGIGIAAAGTAIAGTWPVLLVGALVGGVVGNEVGKRAKRRQAGTELDDTP